jgi:protoheme IX farnesyltransferase
MSNGTHAIAKPQSKVKDYATFIKLRLASLVVFSAVISYAISAKGNINWLTLSMLTLGGFLVTGASNGFNQIIERHLDKLMHRTQNRPLPQGRMSVNEAFWLATIMGGAGILILTVYTNVMSGILGLAALILYTVVYTPLKQKTPFAVFVGAFPGAIPPLLGHVAGTAGFGEIQFTGLVLFFVQFMWQFPHFWAIAWVMDEDYKRAGFKMLPSPGGRDTASAFQVLVYTLFLTIISLAPTLYGISGTVALITNILCGAFFSWQAIQLYKNCSVEAARKLMFGSFFYLPIVQLATLLG